MRDLAFMALGAATFIVIDIGIVEAVNYSTGCTGPFVKKVIALQNQQPGEIVFYKVHADGDAIKFMANLDKPIKPRFIKSPESILMCKEPAYFIAADKDLADLPKDVAQHVKYLDSGKIGHKNYVVFNISEAL